jgi:hypothetical protein
MADEAGTGFRFEGKTQDLEGNSQDFIDALDGAYLATDAQARTDLITYDTEGPDPYLELGVLGNPQLDGNGDPVRNFVTVWLPDSYLAAAGSTVDAAVATGFDVVNSPTGGRRASRPRCRRATAACASTHRTSASAPPWARSRPTTGPPEPPRMTPPPGLLSRSP